MSNDMFPLIQHHVIHHVLSRLSEKLTYHNVEHTSDVLEQVQRIGMEEGISEEDLLLLKIAALYHDTGFLSKYEGHEEIGCELVREDLPGFGFTEEQVDKICHLIMATRVPQRPGNKLEEIICDADLDYLGQDDFESISDSLRKEFLEFGIIHSDEEWFARQIKFLETHKYFTESSRKHRNPVKCQHLDKLKSE